MGELFSACWTCFLASFRSFPGTWCWDSALSSWPSCPDPLASAASLFMHSSICLGLPGASGTQTRGQPPGALVQAATPGGLAGLTASPATREGARPRGWRGGAHRPSEGWGVRVGLGPGLRGEGRAAGVDGGAHSTHPGSQGAQGCVHVSPLRVLVGRRASPEAPPPRWRAAQIWGKQPDVAPPPSPRSRPQQPRRPTGGDRAKGHCHPRASSAKIRGFHTQLDEGPETPIKSLMIIQWM